MRFELFIAWRCLVAKRREKFISLIGFISVFGVAVGVACLIVVLSVMAGFDNDLKEKIIGVNPHILVENAAGMPEIDPIIDRLKAMDDVAGISAYINGQVILKTAQMTSGAVMRGIDGETEADITKIKEYLTKGGLPSLPGQIVVGKELAHIFGLDLGSRMDVISPVDGKKYGFDVCGIFSCGMYDYDSNFVFVNLQDAQQIFCMPRAITGVGVKLKDAYRAGAFAGNLRRESSYMYNIKTWTELNSNLFSALRLERTTMFIILTLITIVACFNIASTLIMMVLEKTKDIGVLKAIGATNRAVGLIFTLEGLIIGCMGAVLGVGAGVGLCNLLKKYQFVQLPKEIYYIDRLPVQIQWADAALISAAAILLALLATVYPALQASRLNPVEALRYE